MDPKAKVENPPRRYAHQRKQRRNVEYEDESRAEGSSHESRDANSHQTLEIHTALSSSEAP